MYNVQNSVAGLLGIQYPIVQGGMAWIAEYNLAAAVSEAGGLGVIACGNAPGAFVRDQIRLLREKTDKPFACNIMLMSPFVEEVVSIVCEEKVPIVTTGAGSPAKYMARFQEAGIKVIPVVASVALAKMMEKLGATAVIAEGMEAGGHIGKLTTMAMVPQIVDAVNIPVLAAGGIADGRGVAASFALGAQGVQVGTRFLTAEECIVHENYKAAVLKAKDIDTVVTGRLAGQHPVRGIRNRLTREFELAEAEEVAKETPDLHRLEQLGVGRLRNAAVDGDVANGSVYAGQIAGLVKERKTCAEIIEELMAQWQQTASQMNI